MKRSTLIVAIIACAIIALGVVIGPRLKRVTFELGRDVASLDVYTKNEAKIATIDKDHTSTWLLTGEYTVIPRGERINTQSITTKVSESKTITIAPSYDATYLAEQTPEATEKVQAILTSTYPAMKEYQLVAGTLYRYGDWYGGVLFNKESTGNNKRDFYRFVAQKSEGQWKLVNSPELIISKSQYTKVPTSVVDAINNLRPDESLLER